MSRVIMIRNEKLFDAVKKYAKSGLPDGHFGIDDDGINDDEEEGMTKKKKHFIDDGRYEIEFAGYESVIFAARCRDGLTMDSDVFPYESFHESVSTYVCNDHGMNLWTKEYQMHSEVVFKHIIAINEEKLNESLLPKNFCTETGHIHDDLNKSNFCNTTTYQLELKQYHLDNIEGNQSQSLMREKIYYMLEKDIAALPKTKRYTRTSRASAATICKYFHSCAIVLCSFVTQFDWLSFKVYGSDDFAVMFDASHRVSNALKILIDHDVFENKSTYQQFIQFNNCIKDFVKFNVQYIEMFESEGLKRTLFFSVHDQITFDKYAKQLLAKYEARK